MSSWSLGFPLMVIQEPRPLPSVLAHPLGPLGLLPVDRRGKSMEGTCFLTTWLRGGPQPFCLHSTDDTLPHGATWLQEVLAMQSLAGQTLSRNNCILSKEDHEFWVDSQSSLPLQTFSSLITVHFDDLVHFAQQSPPPFPSKYFHLFISGYERRHTFGLSQFQ